MTGRETYRGAVYARLPGGDECTLLVLRVGDRVLLLYHAAVRTGGGADAAASAGAGRDAARRRVATAGEWQVTAAPTSPWWLSPVRVSAPVTSTAQPGAAALLLAVFLGVPARVADP